MRKFDLAQLTEQFLADARKLQPELRRWVGDKLVELEAQQERALDASRTRSTAIRKHIPTIISPVTAAKRGATGIVVRRLEGSGLDVPDDRTIRSELKRISALGHGVYGTAQMSSVSWAMTSTASSSST